MIKAPAGRRCSPFGKLIPMFAPRVTLLSFCLLAAGGTGQAGPEGGPVRPDTPGSLSWIPRDTGAWPVLKELEQESAFRAKPAPSSPRHFKYNVLDIQYHTKTRAAAYPDLDWCIYGAGNKKGSKNWSPSLCTCNRGNTNYKIPF